MLCLFEDNLLFDLSYRSVSTTDTATTGPVLKLQIPKTLPPPTGKVSPLWPTITEANNNSKDDVREAVKVKVSSHLIKTPNGSPIYISVPAEGYNPDSIAQRFRYDCHNWALGCWDEFLLSDRSLWNVLHDDNLASIVVANGPTTDQANSDELSTKVQDYGAGRGCLFETSIQPGQIQKGDLLVFWYKDGGSVVAQHTIKIVEVELGEDDQYIDGSTRVLTKDGCGEVKSDTLDGVFTKYDVRPFHFRQKYVDGLDGEERERWAGVYRLK